MIFNKKIKLINIKLTIILMYYKNEFIEIYITKQKVCRNIINCFFKENMTIANRLFNFLEFRKKIFEELSFFIQNINIFFSNLLI